MLITDKWKYQNMLNRDINSRFEDWLLNPTESLDFEVKQWLDMNDVESQGMIAKALIALENHGGGFLLFGYQENEQKKLVPDQARPLSLESYLTDAINNIIKKRAEPAFHVEVTLQKHPITEEEYPLVHVSGQSKVPIRSDSETPGKSLKQNVYYIRAPGPESRAPLNAAEWDSLLRHVLINQREEIVDLFRSLLPSFAPLIETPPNEQQQLLLFVEAARKRWQGLNESLSSDNPARIKLGYYAFAARILGTSKNISNQAIIEANMVARKYTGWPVFLTTYQEPTKPRLVEGCIEAWLANINHPDVGYADFWRIDPKGNFYLLRGYQEDSIDLHKGFGEVGTLFEASLPVWRLGEFLLRVVDLGSVMFDEGFELVVMCEWYGIANRKLFFHSMRRFLPENHKAVENVVKTEVRLTQQEVRELLPDVVKKLTKSLYEHFDFFTPPDLFYAEELAEMKKSRR